MKVGFVLSIFSMGTWLLLANGECPDISDVPTMYDEGRYSQQSGDLSVLIPVSTSRVGSKLSAIPILSNPKAKINDCQISACV
jgi:hypothetical protein